MLLAAPLVSEGLAKLNPFVTSVALLGFTGEKAKPVGAASVVAAGAPPNENPPVAAETEPSTAGRGSRRTAKVESTSSSSSSYGSPPKLKPPGPMPE